MSARCLKVGTVHAAWNLIGYDGDHYLRIVGGRTRYETVMFEDSGRARNVRLARLDVTNDGIRQINRYVNPDTLLEIVH